MVSPSLHCQGCQTIVFASQPHSPSPLLTDQPITLSLRVSSMVPPSLHCQGWPKPPPPPALLARITGVKPLSYPGQTISSRPCPPPPPWLSVRHMIWECTYTYFLWTRIFVPSTHYPSPLFTDQPLTLSLRVSSMVSPSLHCQDWPVLLSFTATQSPPPPALSPSLLARITGVKPLSYPGQTFPSRPYASHYETSPPPLGSRSATWFGSVRIFSQTIIFASNTHYPPLFTKFFHKWREKRESRCAPAIIILQKIF